MLSLVFFFNIKHSIENYLGATVSENPNIKVETGACNLQHDVTDGFSFELCACGHAFSVVTSVIRRIAPHK